MRYCTDGDVRSWRSLSEGDHRLVGVPGCATSLSCPHKKIGQAHPLRASLPFLFGIRFTLSQDEFPRFTVR